jgi:hypothetical protein
MAEKSASEKPIGRRDVLRSAATTGAAAFSLSGHALASDTNPEDVTAYRMQNPATEVGDRTVRIKAKESVDYQFR